MRFLILIVLTTGCFAAGNSSSERISEQNGGFCDSKPNGHYSTVASCSSEMIICVAGQYVDRVQCPFNLVFDEKYQRCDNAVNVGSCGMRSADVDEKYDYPNFYGSCLSDGYSSVSECSTSFVKCEDGVPELFECTNDKVFDRISGQCIESYESDECSTFSSEKDEEVAADERGVRKDKKSLDGIENIYSCAGRVDGLYSLGCESQFLTCGGGVSRIMRCPVDLIYNNVTDACDYPVNVIGCSGLVDNNIGDGVCAGMSSDEWFEVNNCSSFFFTCRQGEKVQLACPSKLIFSAETLRCEYPHDIMGCRESSEKSPEIFADSVQPSRDIPNEGFSDSEKLSGESEKSAADLSNMVEKASGKSSSESQKPSGKLFDGSNHSTKLIDESNGKSSKKVKKPKKLLEKLPAKSQDPSHKLFADPRKSFDEPRESSGTSSGVFEESSGTSSGVFEESSGTSSSDFQELSGELFADSEELLGEFEESSGSLSLGKFEEFSGVSSGEFEGTSGASSGELSIESEVLFSGLFADSAKSFELEESSGNDGSGESSGESSGFEASAELVQSADLDFTETSGNELLLDFSGSEKSTLFESVSSESSGDSENSFSSDDQAIEVSDLLAAGATDCTDQSDGFYGQGCSSLMVACKDGLPTPMTCPTELKYSVEKQICDLPANVAACSQEVSNDAADELLDADTAIDHETSSESFKRLKRSARHSHKHNEMAILLCHDKKNGRRSLGCEESFLTCHRGRGHVMECKTGKTLDESLQRCVPLELHPTCFQRARSSERDQVAIFDVNGEQETIESSGEGSGESSDKNAQASQFACQKDGYFAKTICAPNFIHCYHGKPCEMTCDYGYFYSSSVQMCLRPAEMPECMRFLALQDV